MHLDRLDWVSNSAQTRWFLVLHVQRRDELDRLLQLSNRTLALFGQPPLYGVNDDCFHVSIGWCLEEPSDDHRKRAARLKGGRMAIRFGDIKVKIGLHVSSVLLSIGL